MLKYPIIRYKYLKKINYSKGIIWIFIKIITNNPETKMFRFNRMSCLTLSPGLRNSSCNKEISKFRESYPSLFKKMYFRPKLSSTYSCANHPAFAIFYDRPGQIRRTAAERIQRTLLKSIYLHNVVREKSFYAFSVLLMLEQSARAEWYSGNRRQSLNREPSKCVSMLGRRQNERKKHNFISGIVVDDDLTALIYSYNIFCEFFFFYGIYLSRRAVERGWNIDKTPPHHPFRKWNRHKIDVEALITHVDCIRIPHYHANYISYALTSWRNIFPSLRFLSASAKAFFATFRFYSAGFGVMRALAGVSTDSANRIYNFTLLDGALWLKSFQLNFFASKKWFFMARLLS